MISFENDYTTGAHPLILERLIETNLENLTGYGQDHYCKSAKEKIKAACSCPEAEVELLVGGTQTNMVVISTMLKDHEGVIAAKTGHVSMHEAGAIEFCGHKVLELPHKDGKLNANTIEQYIKDFYADDSFEHMVFPGMVYISYPTEYGTLYSKNELTDISTVCRKYNIPLFIDGARLGYGLMSKDSDLTLADIAELSDVFYIGGTKAGALFGEAVVFTKNNRPPHFMTSVKRRGALLAKGRLLGIQFDTMFSNDLYFEISKHVISMAEKLKSILTKKGFEFFIKSPTNQQFVIMDNDLVKSLKDKVSFSIWEKYDDTHTVVRFATGWSTTEDDLTALDKLL